MSLRIISGRAGTGKTTYIHCEMIEDLKTNPLGAPIFIIVPDQMSFSTEYDLTNKYDVDGIMRAQVVTFKRLAWYILQLTGGIARDMVDSTGYRMLIRRVLEDHKEEFQLFKQAAGKQGFTQEIEKLLREFTQFNVTTETIGPIIENLQQLNASPTLLAKMQDLSLILTKLKEHLGDTYTDSEGFYPILQEKIAEAGLQEAQIYLDGFVAFTKREFDVLAELIKHTKRVTIVLPFEQEADAFDNGAVFHRGAATYVKLMEFAQTHGIEIEAREIFTDNYRYANDDLQHIECNFNAPRPMRQAAQGNVRIIEGANRRAEVQAIAREILRLVQEEGYRYKEIGIMHRQAEAYDNLISMTFAQYGIPVFSNEKRPMLHHPLIEFARSTLEAIATNWQYEPLFRAIKTDLFFPAQANVRKMREQMDELENFVIEKGLVGHRWETDDYWRYKKVRSFEKIQPQSTKEQEKERALHYARDLVREPLQKLKVKIENAHQGRDIAIALYEYVDELQVFDKLVRLKDREEAEGEHDLSSEHEQAWNGWVNVLDQFVIMFGDVALTLEQAGEILEEGYSALQFSNIPPTIDEVTVSTVEYSRFDNMKAIFIIGVNDGIYPMRMDNEGLISDVERETMQQIDVELSPSSKSRLLQEAFLFYRAISSPTNRLYITFASADEESKALLPSLYINRLHKLFEVEGKRTLPHERIFIDPIEELDESKWMHYIRHPRPSIAYLTMQLKRAHLEQKLGDEWIALKAFYEQDEEWNRVLQVAMTPLTKKNEAEPLKPEVTEKLYGNELQGSVSRLERFYQCAFSHFATYGLRLDERAEFRLETFAMGDLFHEALRQILSEKEAEPLKTYSQCLAKAREKVEQLVGIFSYRILESNARYTYIKEKLIRIIGRTLFALTTHNEKSRFKPLAHELSFGMTDMKSTSDEEQQKSLKALEISLNHNRKMKLRGQIDRIDGYQDGNDLFLRVVDYKSSSRDLDLSEVYHGISLQLLTYLDVAMRNIGDLVELENLIARSAGVLYVHVHDPLLTLEDYSDASRKLSNARFTYRQSISVRCNG